MGQGLGGGEMWRTLSSKSVLSRVGSRYQTDEFAWIEARRGYGGYHQVRGLFKYVEGREVGAS